MIIQATSFSLYGKMIRTTNGRRWPTFVAQIFDSNGSVHDTRKSFNDYELLRWIESFGFDLKGN